MKTGICKISFKSAKKLRFEKGSQYEIAPMIGCPGVKLFRIYNECGDSFATTESHVNKFFTIIQ